LKLKVGERVHVWEPEPGGACRSRGLEVLGLMARGACPTGTGGAALLARCPGSCPLQVVAVLPVIIVAHGPLP
jgi:hypothetical protein